MKSYKHEASGAELCRPIAQPHVTTFAECFPDWAEWIFEPNKREVQKFQSRTISGQAIADNLYEDAVATMRGKKQPKHREQTMEIGPFLSFGGYDRPSLSVSPADWVLSRVRENTIIVPHDTMSFEIHDHANGWSLVSAHHGQILGSVWLAYIRTDSIPVTKRNQ